MDDQIIDVNIKEANINKEENSDNEKIHKNNIEIDLNDELLNNNDKDDNCKNISYKIFSEFEDNCIKPKKILKLSDIIKPPKKPVIINNHSFSNEETEYFTDGSDY